MPISSKLSAIILTQLNHNNIEIMKQISLTCFSFLFFAILAVGQQNIEEVQKLEHFIDEFILRVTFSGQSLNVTVLWKDESSNYRKFADNIKESEVLEKLGTAVLSLEFIFKVFKNQSEFNISANGNRIELIAYQNDGIKIFKKISTLTLKEVELTMEDYVRLMERDVKQQVLKQITQLKRQESEQSLEYVERLVEENQEVKKQLDENKEEIQRLKIQIQKIRSQGQSSISQELKVLRGEIEMQKQISLALSEELMLECEQKIQQSSEKLQENLSEYISSFQSFSGLTEKRLENAEMLFANFNKSFETIINESRENNKNEIQQAIKQMRDIQDSLLSRIIELEASSFSVSTLAKDHRDIVSSIYDLTTPYANRFKIQGNIVEYQGEQGVPTMVLMQRTIRFEEIFRFHCLVRMSKEKTPKIGVVDRSQERQNRVPRSEQNYVSYSGNGSILGDSYGGKTMGFNSGQIITVQVSLKNGHIKWLIGEEVRASENLEILKEKERRFAPFLELKNVGDSFECNY